MISNQAALWRVVDLRANFTSRDSFKYLLADDIFQVKPDHTLPDIHARNVQLPRYEEKPQQRLSNLLRPLTVCPGQALGRKGVVSSFSAPRLNCSKSPQSFRRKPESRFVHQIRLTQGSSKALGLHSGTVNAVCEQYAKSRSQKKRPYLRYRGKRNLGWVPLKGRELKREGDAFRFAGNTFRVFNSRALPEGKIKDGTNFSQDSRGNWFLNSVIDVAVTPVDARQPVRGVGIDLGLKDFATLSTGEKIEVQRIYRGAEKALAVAQRAHKKRRVKAIHAKTVNRLNDFHHKLSDRIVREFDYIAVGNVNAAGLAKTNMAKSVLDAGWRSFRNKLAYKAVKHGAWFEEVSERLTSQVCSDCGALPDSRPKGIADLGMRNWICSDCGCEHDRDVNAAKNILKKFSFPVGHDRLAVGIPVL